MKQPEGEYIELVLASADAYNRKLRQQLEQEWAEVNKLKAAHSAPKASQPVALTDALRRSGANTDYHGLITFTPEQLKTFAALLSATSQPSAWDQAIEALGRKE